MKKLITALSVAAVLAVAPTAAMAKGLKHQTILATTAASAGVGALIAGPVGAIVGGAVGLLYTTQR